MSHALRAVARRALAAPRTASTPSIVLPRVCTPRVAALSTSASLRASGPPLIQGEGAKSGEVATDLQQATGLERFELLGKLEGTDVFDMSPLEPTRLGTTKDPIKIQSLFPERQVGCTGFPAGAHDTIWLAMNTEIQFHRCPECGSVYELDFIGEKGSHDHH